jgi:hypothetical protein
MWAPILTFAVLAALIVDDFFIRPKVALAEAYHDYVRATVESLPEVFDGWLGKDVPIPRAAIAILHPNVILSRSYRNITTGEEVTFLLVQVKDARDILGHYPPVCYPAEGWSLVSKADESWADATKPLDGEEYSFERDRLSGSQTLTVDNFLLLPDGTRCRDMKQIVSASQSRLHKLFGAAQVQVVFQNTLTPQRRTEIVEEFIRFSRPALDAIGTGNRYASNS